MNVHSLSSSRRGGADQAGSPDSAAQETSTQTQGFDESTGSSETDALLVSRQPIFDRDKNVWGHELFLQDCAGENSRKTLDPDISSFSMLLADGYVMGTRGLSADRNICLNISLKNLYDVHSLALPTDKVWIEIAASEYAATPLETLTLLRERGFRVILDKYVGEEVDTERLDFADFIKINFMGTNPRRIIELRSMLKERKHALAAVGIDDWISYEGARALGFQTFQGHFFSVPEIVAGRKLPSHKATRVKLVKALYAQTDETEAILEAIGADPPLAYRLLRYINSPGFGLANKVTTLRHAVALLGCNALRNWAMAVVVADMDCSDKGSELSWLALHRALFLQALAEQGLAGEWDSESMFLLGLFSTIDAMIGLSMDEVLQELPLDPRLAKALTAKGQARPPWLILLCHLEAGRLDEMRTLLAQLSIPPGKAAKMYLTAGRQASETMREVAQTC